MVVRLVTKKTCDPAWEGVRWKKMEGDGRRLETHGSHATRWPRASTGISSKVSGRAKQVKDSGATFIVINHRQRVIVNVEFQPVAHVLGESILHRPLFSTQPGEPVNLRPCHMWRSFSISETRTFILTNLTP